MGEIRPPLARRVLTYVVGGALLAVAAMAVGRVVALREAAITRERDRLEQYVQDQVDAWEGSLVEFLDQSLEAAAVDSAEADARQRRLRRMKPWFNSLYVWTHEAPDGSISDKAWARFPLPAIGQTEADLLLRRPCLQRARWMVEDPTIDPIQAARAFHVGCQREPLTVQLIASTEAAYQLDGIGQLQLALQVLESVDLPEDASLLTLAQQGLPPFRVATHRMLRATLLLRLGETDRALDLLERTGQDITALDAPDAIPTLPFVDWPILAQLESHGRLDDAGRLRGRLRRAQSRVYAYREIDQRVLPRSPSRASEPPRFIYDQYSSSPYVLYYGWIGDVGVGLQLEQDLLLADFLSSRMRGLRRAITITDADGTWVAGTRKPNQVAFVVPFARTLTNLRVGVQQEALDELAAKMEDQWILAVVVIVIFSALGLLALGAQAKATRRQYELLNRQRAFTTRVTHELKTPLAGIRVMAENLEAGAFRNDAQRQKMARRILEEADRLTERVDEVLAVARERTIPSPEPFDPEEPLLEAIDAWGPRFEVAGVRLAADLHPTDEVLGNANAFRDAVACLLDNALKYHREDRTDPSVWLELRQEGRKVVVEVKDNGLGVPRAQRKTIFQRFERVEGDNRGKAGGHGLGLFQVAEIVRAHKGTVQCTEGVDGGASFVMRLPANV